MLWDLMRYLVAGLGAALFGLAVVVSWMAWRGEWPTRPHVFSLGVAFALLTISTYVDFAEAFGHPPTWRLPVYAVAYASGAYGLFFIRGRKR